PPLRLPPAGRPGRGLFWPFLLPSCEAPSPAARPPLRLELSEPSSVSSSSVSGMSTSSKSSSSTRSVRVSFLMASFLLGALGAPSSMLRVGVRGRLVEPLSARKIIRVPRLARGIRIDAPLGEIGELPIEALLVVERLLHELGDLLMAHLLGEGAHRSVSRHLVVHDALRGGDQSGVADAGVSLGAHDVLHLLDQTLHRVAGFAFRLLAQLAKRRLEPRQVGTSDRILLPKHGRQLRSLRLVGELALGLTLALLGVVQIFELFHEEIVHRIELLPMEKSHRGIRPFLSCG